MAAAIGMVALVHLASPGISEIDRFVPTHTAYSTGETSSLRKASRFHKHFPQEDTARNLELGTEAVVRGLILVAIC